MARLVLVYGKDPLTRRLAEEIIASQTAEVAAMRERLAILRRGDDPNPGSFRRFTARAASRRNDVTDWWSW